MTDALAVAAEHHAFCPDNVRQGYDTIREYAAEGAAGEAALDLLVGLTGGAVFG